MIEEKRINAVKSGDEILNISRQDFVEETEQVFVISMDSGSDICHIDVLEEDAKCDIHIGIRIRGMKVLADALNDAIEKTKAVI